MNETPGEFQEIYFNQIVEETKKVNFNSLIPFRNICEEVGLDYVVI